MKLLTRHEFTNDALLETYYLSPADQARFSVPECDVIGLRRVTAQGNDSMTVMRPDEALIQAQMLVSAVLEITEGYATETPEPQLEPVKLHVERNPHPYRGPYFLSK